MRMRSRERVTGTGKRHIALARVGTAVALTSLGALAVGAFAIGALAIRALAVKTARIGRLQIDELIIGGERFRTPIVPSREGGFEGELGRGSVGALDYRFE